METGVIVGAGTIVVIVIVGLVIDIISASVCVSIMENKGYSAGVGTFLFAFFLVPIGYVYVIAMPDLYSRPDRSIQKIPHVLSDMCELVRKANEQLEICNKQLEDCKKTLAQLQQTPPNK